MENLAVIFASIISAVGTIAAVWIKNKFDYKKKNTLESANVSRINIYKALEYIQSQTNCARAYVFEFHNGEHFFSGRGQQKFSCTYECVRAGVSAESLNSQGHRISNYNSYISTLISDGVYKSNDTSTIRDQAFKSLLESKGVKAIYNVPIKTLNGKVIGILGIEYLVKKNNFDISSKGLAFDRFMRMQARAISGYLC